MATRCEFSPLRGYPAKRRSSTVIFDAIRRRRVTVEYDDDHSELCVTETPPSPAPRHRISLPNPPVLRGGDRGDLETSISAYLTSEGVTPAEGQHIAAAVLAFLDRWAGGGDHKAIRVYAKLEFMTDEVVWIGRMPYLDTALIRKLHAEKLLSLDEGTCAICLEENFTGTCKQRWLTTLPCKHTFHQLCIFRWLHTSLTCPNCRREIHEDYRREEDLPFR